MDFYILVLIIILSLKKNINKIVYVERKNNKNNHHNFLGNIDFYMDIERMSSSTNFYQYIIRLFMEKLLFKKHKWGQILMN